MNEIKLFFQRLSHMLNPSNTDELIIIQNGQVFRANFLVYLAQQGVSFSSGANSNIRTTAVSTVVVDPILGTITVTFNVPYDNNNYTVVPIMGDDVNYLKESLVVTATGFTADYLGAGTDFGFVTILN